jgi:hypothetical protein
MTESLLKLIAKVLANIKGDDNKFTFKDVERIAGWVIEQDKTENSGLKKAEVIVDKFNAEWKGRLSWVVKTVVQICYALVQLRSLTK